MENGETTISQTPPTIQGVVIDIVRKQGMLGLVLVALLYFIWDNSKKIAPVIERNSDVIGKNSVVLDKAIEAGDRNNRVLERVERKMSHH